MADCLARGLCADGSNIRVSNQYLEVIQKKLYSNRY